MRSLGEVLGSGTVESDFLLGGVGEPAYGDGFSTGVLGGGDERGLDWEDAFRTEADSKFVDAELGGISVNVNVFVAGIVNVEFGPGNGILLVGSDAQLRIHPHRSRIKSFGLKFVTDKQKIRLISRGMNLRYRIVGVESVKIVVGDAGVVADDVQIDSSVGVGGGLQKQGDPEVGLTELTVMEALSESLVWHAAEIYRFAVKLKAARRSGELVYAVRIFQ